MIPGGNIFDTLNPAPPGHNVALSAAYVAIEALDRLVAGCALMGMLAATHELSPAEYVTWAELVGHSAREAARLRASLPIVTAPTAVEIAP